MGRSGSFVYKMGSFGGFLLLPILIVAIIWGVKTKRGNPCHWQRWFFWLALIIPAIARNADRVNVR